MVEVVEHAALGACRQALSVGTVFVLGQVDLVEVVVKVLGLVHALVPRDLARAKVVGQRAWSVDLYV